jgi:hypothetical protein
MKTTCFAAILCAGIAVIPAFCFIQTPPNALDKPLSTLAREAVSDDQTIAANAIQRLRAAGPAGLDALFEAHTNAIQPSATDDKRWIRVHDALDAVGQQRDCYASHLYWYTDLEQAKAAARASGKPILSLRLLGNLNEEYSCANSRFFRTTLYANADVSRVLREQFILHWQSVRPVPRITIDFGEGRKLERTITGNSIHYILDSEGRIVDALPGLYGSVAFLKGLEQARETAMRVAKLSDSERTPVLNQYHAEALQNVRQEWQRDRAKLGLATPGVGLVNLSSLKIPTAEIAAARTYSKTAVEAPLLRGMATDASSLESLAGLNSDSEWNAIAALHLDDVRLDSGAFRLIEKKEPAAEDAVRLARSKALIETPMMRMVWNLERSIAEDTVRNEYLFHARIHEWLSNGPSEPLDTFNKKVYAELFLTPDSDPWLGLAPADVFSALDRGGLSQATVNQ